VWRWRLLRLDRQSGQVAQAVELGAGAFPSSVVVTANAVWVGNEGPSTVARVDATNEASAKIDVGGVPSDLAVSDGRVYVSVRQQ
jgi:streptogramin lyase